MTGSSCRPDCLLQPATIISMFDELLNTVHGASNLLSDFVGSFAVPSPSSQVQFQRASPSVCTAALTPSWQRQHTPDCR